MDVKKQKSKIKGTHTFTLLNPDGTVKERKVFENIIVLAGRARAGQILAGIVETEGVNYCALGTGSTTVDDTDTTMESEGARKLRGTSQSSDDSFIIAFYFTPTEANGSWTRYATFIDGTATADSGYLFTHAAISLTKAEGEGLTITSQYELSDNT